METGIEEKRVAIEAICTLAHIKRIMIDLLLKPAGVPAEVYRSLINQRDEISGRHLTKRQMAPLIIEALDKSQDGPSIIRAIVKIASEWTSFHLADDEFAARATVQKAREIMGTLDTMAAREAQQRELARKEN